MSETLFVYTDSKGEITRRRVVNTKKFLTKTSNHQYMQGFDLDAKAVRTFRVDRMQLLDDTISKEYWQSLAEPTLSKKAKQDAHKIEIHFTGFPRKDVKPQLEAMAKDADMLVRKSVTSNLGMLVLGYNAGRVKISKARKKQAYILTEEEFLNFIKTGEIPYTKPQGSVSDTEASPTPIAQAKSVPADTHLLNEPYVFFKNWHYHIDTYHWATLGVNNLYPVDSQKTADLKQKWHISHPQFKQLKTYFNTKGNQIRNQLKQEKYHQGIENIKQTYPQKKRQKKQLNDLYQAITKEVKQTLKSYPDYAEYKRLRLQLSRQKIQYHTFGYQIPRKYNFQEGDVFYIQPENTDNYLQVIYCKDSLLEVNHTVNKYSMGYHIEAAQLADWLETGICPSKKYRIDKSQSFSEIAKFHIYT